MKISILFRLFCKNAVVSYVLQWNFTHLIGARPASIDSFAQARRLVGFSADWAFCFEFYQNSYTVFNTAPYSIAWLCTTLVRQFGAPLATLHGTWSLYNIHPCTDVRPLCCLNCIQLQFFSHSPSQHILFLFRFSYLTLVQNCTCGMDNSRYQVKESRPSLWQNSYMKSLLNRMEKIMIQSTRMANPKIAPK